MDITHNFGPKPEDVFGTMLIILCTIVGVSMLVTWGIMISIVLYDHLIMFVDVHPRGALFLFPLIGSAVLLLCLRMCGSICHCN
jgi:hypothetical protein